MVAYESTIEAGERRAMVSVGELSVWRMRRRGGGGEKEDAEGRDGEKWVRRMLREGEAGDGEAGVGQSGWWCEKWKLRKRRLDCLVGVLSRLVANDAS